MISFMASVYLNTYMMQVWNVHSVLNVLHSFVDKSNIDQQLEVFNATAGKLLLSVFYLA